MSSTRYSIGIDVGKNSTGLAAVELDDDDNVIRILNAQSVIHDGGVDPSSRKSGDSRLAVSGQARRSRRLQRQRRRRLKLLDRTLSDLGYPKTVSSPILDEPFAEWQCRARLAETTIADEKTRDEMMAISLRHIARHRGWRNPYTSVTSLHNVSSSDLSDEYHTLAEQSIGNKESVLTPGQLVMAYLRQKNGGPAPRLRHKTSKTGKEIVEVIPARMRQQDYAYEISAICRKQSISQDETNRLIDAVFAAKSPRGSAEKRVGKDPFNQEPRALKASLVFQQYRIAAMIVNLRVRTAAGNRPLTVDEKQTIYDRLCEQTSRDAAPLWEDVSDWIDIPRQNLEGVGKVDKFGERVSNNPPLLESEIALANLSLNSSVGKRLAKQMRQWWSVASFDEKEAMIEFLSNSVNTDRAKEDVRFASVLDFVDDLDDEELGQLDNISLPSGRAVYSVDTLKKLTHQMLTTPDDLRSALEHLYKVGPNWTPPQPPIGMPVGNPAVDRVLKIVNRYLLACQARWGQPVRVVIEHTRGGFVSEKANRQYEQTTDHRYTYKREIAKELLSKGIRPSEADIRRCEAVQRQNGKCLYCGREITFSSCEMDHIVPRRGIGGSDNRRTNLAAVCPECNREKSNIPFGTWSKSDAVKNRGVSLEGAIDRVNNFLFSEETEIYGRIAQRNFKRSMIARLKRTTLDDPLDERSMESVAWMADELHRRIDWHYNTSIRTSSTNDYSSMRTEVFVYPGSITAIARRASQIEGKIHFIGAHQKTRFDRRHHAVDALVMATMDPQAAYILSQKALLRQSQRIGALEPDEISWKDYPTPQTVSAQRYERYQAWLARMDHAVKLMNDRLDNNLVPVVHWKRLRLGIGQAHDDTINALEKHTLSEAMSADLIRRASAPALFAALTSLPDYSEKQGLPANPRRSIVLNGTPVFADEQVGFFASNAAEIAVRGGSAQVGNAIHHARIYRYWTANARGKKKIQYGMIRVFQADLLHSLGSDLFSVPLRRCSLSMRYADPKVSQAVLDGRAEFIGTLCVGDELIVHFDVNPPQKGQIAGFLAAFKDDAAVNPAVVMSWVVDGFASESKLRLRPLLMAGEGLQKLIAVSPSPNLGSHSSDIEAIAGDKGPGWRIAVNVLASLKPEVLRRNTLGEPRRASDSHLPLSYRWIW